MELIYNILLSRNKFEEINAELFNKIMIILEKVEKVIRDSGIKKVIFLMLF